MAMTSFADTYREYIACLNSQRWDVLGEFVHDEVRYNGVKIGLSGYRDLLQSDFRQIPDLQFYIQIIACDPPQVAARLNFNCTPTGAFLGIPVNGAKISFSENVFYEFKERKIWNVWSVIDKAAIESQLKNAVPE